MINLKACSRCGGDMMVEELSEDIERVCLQCGHRSFAPQAFPGSILPFKRRAARIPRSV